MPASNKWILMWNELLSVPNLPDASVPEGRDESDNVEIKQWGNIPEKQPYHIPHYDMEWLDQILDFARNQGHRCGLSVFRGRWGPISS